MDGLLRRVYSGKVDPPPLFYPPLLHQHAFDGTEKEATPERRHGEAAP